MMKFRFLECHSQRIIIRLSLILIGVLIIQFLSAQNCITKIKYIEDNYQIVPYDTIFERIQEGCDLTLLSENELYRYYSILNDFYALHADLLGMEELNELFKRGDIKLNKRLETKIDLSEADLKYRKGKLTEAYDQLFGMAKQVEAVADSSMMVEYYSSRANIQNSRGNGLEAIADNEMALSFLSDSLPIHKAVILYNIGNILYKEDLFVEALANMELAADIFSKHSPERLSHVDVAICFVSIELDSIKKAERLIDKYISQTDNPFQPYFLLAQTMVNYRKEDYKSAEKNIKLLIQKSEAEEFLDDYSLYKVATLNALALGDLVNAKNRMTKLFDTELLPEIEKTEFDVRYNVLKNNGLENYYKFNSVLRSILNENQVTVSKLVLEKNNQIKSAESKAEFAQLELREKIKTEKLLMRNKQLWFVLSALLLSALFIYYIFIQNRKLKKATEKLDDQNSQILLLNRELNHRVKNNLGFMTALLEMQGRRTKNEETRQLLLESESRLKTLSLVHSNLLKTQDKGSINLSDYLKQLTNHLHDAYSTNEKDLNIMTELSDFDIDAEDAMRIGLITNELITNSVKHAFQQTDHPEIYIHTFIDGAGKLNYFYKDNGPGFSHETTSPQENSQSLGRKLITLLKEQLKEKYVLEV